MPSEFEKNICKLCTYTYSTANVKRQINFIYCYSCIKFTGECNRDVPKNINPCKDKDNCKDLRSCKSCRFKKLQFCEEYQHIFEKSKAFFNLNKFEIANQYVSPNPDVDQNQFSKSFECHTIGCNLNISLSNINYMSLENNYCNFCQNFYFKWIYQERYLQLKCINKENFACEDLENCYHCKFNNLILSGFLIKCK